MTEGGGSQHTHTTTTVASITPTQGHTHTYLLLAAVVAHTVRTSSQRIDFPLPLLLLRLLPRCCFRLSLSSHSSRASNPRPGRGATGAEDDALVCTMGCLPVMVEGVVRELWCA